MTQKEKRVKLAEAYGLQNIDPEDWWGWDFNGIEMPGDMPSMVKVPDYFHCLNACHELEKILTFHQETEYIANLMRVHKDYPMTKGFMASAQERAEAIGLTLGLWK